MFEILCKHLVFKSIQSDSIWKRPNLYSGNRLISKVNIMKYAETLHCVPQYRSRNDTNRQFRSVAAFHFVKSWVHSHEHSQHRADTLHYLSPSSNLAALRILALQLVSRVPRNKRKYNSIKCLTSGKGTFPVHRPQQRDTNSCYNSLSSASLRCATITWRGGFLRQDLLSSTINVS
jgi:hypothetical protein